VNVSAPVRAYVGIGANLGDARQTVREVLRELAALPGSENFSASSLFRSAPLDAQGPDFINAVAGFDTPLAAPELLHALQAIEQRHRRERPYRNAPRTLDLDLLLHGDSVIRSPELEVPHPRMVHRAFVLRPLFELAPDLHIPGLGALAAWLPTVADQSIEPLQGDAGS
jgi:2-amino-4-hydroxy-6-hydroxymethyldihydropteridine diphosphokinase